MKTSTRTLFVLVAAVVSIAACEAAGNLESAADAGENALQVPQMLDSRETPEIELVMQNGALEFYDGVPSETRGFNGDYLGPTIRLYDNSDATITFVNQIGEPTTVHGHGLHVSGEIDGGPQSSIQPGESWQITIPVRQEAGTSWYHPHWMGKTAEHVHSGLAGVYLIEDENSLALDLPREYGVNDIPLVIQDRSFTNGKMNEYAVENRQLFIDGLREDTVVVNGTLNAYHSVPQGWVRLRLLNGSNSRFYRFSLDDGSSFYKIATEGGFLNSPLQIDSIEMAPGERNEIMIDLSDGTGVTLVADLLPVDPGDRGFLERDPRAHVLDLRVDGTLKASGTLPERLNDIAFFGRPDATRTRILDLQMDGNNRQNWNLADHKTMFSINGQSMDMRVINDRIELGAVEIWTVTAERMPHPFHIHGVSFQILSVGGEPPVEEDRGWKDTVVVTREPVEIIMRFDHAASAEFPLMYHCHMLEHEEGGMMGQFTVE